PKQKRKMARTARSKV
nr:Chain B, Nonstructural protein 1 [Influenza A virus H3N2]